ncbi:uncharacterized protein LOC133197895 [Saccostrea echinata]|uniref:uncharacterized protein LOC133197895 n=1 Tax=Saccostrea echinata TaxID=191078 RepID=UPI002A824009|nr:uncharacterized protein LOC133197895 [Saccostrea echinata]
MNTEIDVGALSAMDTVFLRHLNFSGNLALGKSTWQSTSFDSTVGPEKAVDGLNSVLSFDGKQCSISLNGQTTATWWVFLGEIYNIHTVVIYPRTGGFVWNSANQFTSRFLGFSVYVSNTTDKNSGHLCFKDTAYTKSTIPAVANISCPVHGQYVIYYNDRLPDISYPTGYSKYAFTDLCEVEVYGCKAGMFGLNCQKKCSENCLVTNQCKATTGECEDGCKPGWKGLLCNKVCNLGYYGVDCEKECSSFCKISRDYKHVNGSCKEGCKAGWQGQNCLQNQSQEDTAWQSRFYGVLAALFVCLAIIKLLIGIIIMLKRMRWKNVRGFLVRRSVEPVWDINNVITSMGHFLKTVTLDMKESFAKQA